MFSCLECGRRFKTTRAAENAANNGCPKCGGVDIDLDTRSRSLESDYRQQIDASKYASACGYHD